MKLLSEEINSSENYTLNSCITRYICVNSSMLQI